jgi:hypothetical protein
LQVLFPDRKCATIAVMLLSACMAVIHVAGDGIATESGAGGAAGATRQWVVPADKVSRLSRKGNRVSMRWDSTMKAAVEAGSDWPRTVGSSAAMFGRLYRSLTTVGRRE